MRVEALERDVATAMLAAVIAGGQGQQVTLPDPQQIRTDFDAALAAAPEHVADPAGYEMKQALGLRAH